MVNYFRWREVPFAQEQMHAALLRRDDVPDVAFEEQQRIVNSDLPKLRDAGLLTDAEGLGHADQAPIAMVIDYSAPWALAANPQSGSWDLADGSAMFTGNVINWTGYILNWYTALRRLALSVDIVEAGADLSGYKLVLVPTMPKVNITFDVALQAYNGSFIAGIRTASKEQVISIPEGLPPAAGAVRDRLPIKVVRVESLAANLGDQVSFNGVDYNTTNWSEWLECARDGKNASMPAEATYKGYREGKPATCAHKDENGKMSRYM